MDDSASEEYSEDEYCSDAEVAVETKDSVERRHRPDSGNADQNPTIGISCSDAQGPTANVPSSNIAQKVASKGKDVNVESPSDEKAEKESQVASATKVSGAPIDAPPKCAHAKKEPLADADPSYMHNVETSSSDRKRSTYSVARMLELSKPRDHTRATQKLLHLESMPKKEVKLGKSRLRGFLQRMDAAEKTRLGKIERRVQEAQYDTSKGKKMCPNCRSTQSYDEFANDRRICPNEICKGRFEYKCPSMFKLEPFEKRMQKNTERRHEAIEKIKEEQHCSREKRRGKSKIQQHLLDKVDATGKGFLQRMSDDVAKRKDKLSRLEETMRLQEKDTCTFRPKLCIPKKIHGRTTDLMSEPTHRKTNERKYQQTHRTKRRKAKSAPKFKAANKKSMVATNGKMLL